MLLRNSFSQSLAILVFWLVGQGAGSAFAQDEISLQNLQSQWATLDQKLADKAKEIEASETDPGDLQNEYRNMIEQADELVNKLRSAALGAIKDNPKDKSATRLIMGILLNDAENGRDKEVLSIGDILIGQDINPLYFETGAKAERLSISAREIFEELLIRQREAKADNLPRVKLETDLGNIIVELYENQAPNTVANFISLVESGYYGDRIFHRVIEGFMAQAAQSKTDGSGTEGPGYTIPCECYTPETRPHFSHCLSMAHAGRDTGAGQFFLTFSRTDSLDGRHTCFGRVIKGGEVLDKLRRTHVTIQGQEQPIPGVEANKIIKAEVLRKRDHEYKPAKVGDSDSAPESEPAQPPSDPNLSNPDDSNAAGQDSNDSDEAPDAEQADDSGKADDDEPSNDATKP